MIFEFNPNGTAKMIYTEEIDLNELGELNISRASHVEPTASGKWMADMSPVGGPTLGPYKTRKEALAEEIEWLEKNIFGD